MQQYALERYKIMTINCANLPESIVASSLVSIDKELLFRFTRPELIRELEKDLCINHHI